SSRDPALLTLVRACLVSGRHMDPVRTGRGAQPHPVLSRGVDTEPVLGQGRGPLGLPEFVSGQDTFTEPARTALLHSPVRVQASPRVRVRVREPYMTWSLSR